MIQPSIEAVSYTHLDVYKRQSTFSATAKTKMFRDENNKVLGGVCSCIANYFNTDPLIIRIVTLILVFSFGVGIIPYLMLWVVVPSSSTKVIGSVRKRLFRDPCLLYTSRCVYETVSLEIFVQVGVHHFLFQFSKFLPLLLL